MVRRFGKSETPALLERFATALVNRGAVLVALNRPQEALDAYDEVIRRFGKSDSPVLSVEVKRALLRRADIELRGQVIRAQVLLVGGDRSACEHAVEAVLALLPELGFISREVIMALMGVSVDLGPQRMRELIQTSPSKHLLSPLTTALERELGHEPRVAREVDEVAQDIQQTLARLKANRMQSSGPGAD